MRVLLLVTHDPPPKEKLTESNRPVVLIVSAFAWNFQGPMREGAVPVVIIDPHDIVGNWSNFFIYGYIALSMHAPKL